MSSHEHEDEHQPEAFLDRYWQPLVILYGILFVTLLVSLKPTW